MTERQCAAFLGEGIVRAAEVPPVEAAQGLVCRQVARTLRHGDQKFLLGLGEPLCFHERLPQQRVNAGLEVKQAQRFGGRANGFLETLCPKVDGGQLGMHEGILGV